MNSEAVHTRNTNPTEQRLARLERAVWALVLLLSCVLAAVLAASAWLFAWEQGLDTGTLNIALPLGGA